MANAHTKALDSNFVLLIPPDYPAAAMTFTTRDTALKLINYATINITASDTIPAGASIVMAGKGRFNISSGVTLTFATGSRFDGGRQRRFIGAGSVKFQEGMGITVVSSRNVKILNNHVENTLRDGIHVANGDNTNHGRQVWSENVIITGNTVKNAGDDKILCASYRREPDFLVSKYPTWEDATGAQLINKNIVISNNIVEGGNANSNSRGIAIIGGQQVVVDGNTVRGFTGGKMTSGILVDRMSTLAGFRNLNVVASNNTIVDGQYTSFVDNFGGIKIGSVDSVIVTGNFINWAQYAFGIRVRSDTVGKDFFTNGTRGAIISNNIIQNSRVGISILATYSTTLWNKQISILHNFISNSQRAAISADSVENITVMGNRIEGVNSSSTASIRAIDLNRVDKDVIIKDNVLRSTTSVEYAVAVARPKSTADIRETGNVFNIPTTRAKNFINSGGNISPKYYSQDSIRVHFAPSSPDSGTWAKGDITFNRNPDAGENLAWICTSAGSPGTWTPVGAKINGIGVSDTTGYVLTTAGTATITGVSNIILDAYGGATLDTVTTLTGTTGQIIMVSSRNDSRDFVFQDGTNFKLSQGAIRLQTKDDVLLLKATAASSWKQIALFGGNTRNTQLSLGDTTGFVLSAPGEATVSGFGNIVLDTYGSAALDTAVTLTANIGQILYISTRNSNRDIRFLDSGNFKLGAERLLDNVNDVLALIAITATTFKELFFANDN